MPTSAKSWREKRTSRQPKRTKSRDLVDYLVDNNNWLDEVGWLITHGEESLLEVIPAVVEVGTNGV